MARYRPLVHVVQAWLDGEQPIPDEVRSTIRFLASLRSFRLIKSNTFVYATSRLKVAKLVIKKIEGEL